MADERTQVEVNLIGDDIDVPAPDMLIVGSAGAGWTDVLHVVSEGALKRGTLLMSMAGSDDFSLCTAAGLSSAQVFAVLAEPVVIGKNEYADAAGYLAGEFNADLVIFPWETEDDNHDDLVELARSALRNSGILLRKVVK